MEFIRQNIVWVGLAVVSGTMLLASMVRGRGASSGVSPLAATLMINREDAFVLDVREAPAFATGHIPGARHIPANELGTRVNELKKFSAKPVIVYCQRGVASKAACDTLKRAGFSKTVKLAGGMDAWEEASQPVARA